MVDHISVVLRSTLMSSQLKACNAGVKNDFLSVSVKFGFAGKSFVRRWHGCLDLASIALYTGTYLMACEQKRESSQAHGTGPSGKIR